MRIGFGRGRAGGDVLLVRGVGAAVEGMFPRRGVEEGERGGTDKSLAARVAASSSRGP